MANTDASRDTPDESSDSRLQDDELVQEQRETLGTGGPAKKDEEPPSGGS
jgi:hypothetical protein